VRRQHRSEIRLPPWNTLRGRLRRLWWFEYVFVPFLLLGLGDVFQRKGGRYGPDRSMTGFSI